MEDWPGGGDRREVPTTMELTRRVRTPWPRLRPAVPAWALWTLAMLVLPVAFRLHRLLVDAGRPDLMTWDPLLVVAAVSAATIGAVLASRRPRHPVGWLLLALAVFLAIDGIAAGYGPYGLVVRPGALPAARYVDSFFPAFAVAALACIGFVLLLTPTGSPPSPRWRWWAAVAAAAPLASLLVTALSPAPSTPYQPVATPFDLDALDPALRVTNQVALAVTSVNLLVAAVSLVMRFRRARGVERQQLRWVAFAATIVAVAAVAALPALALGAADLVGSVFAEACVAVLPVAVGAAVLRYRLYDLDRIISRTVAYGVLTVLLGGCYVGVVVGLGQLMGSRGNLAVAPATLAVAAAFRPAQVRIQALVDRRFNRRRYDAQRTIDAFGARLRQQIDLDGLTAELLAVVDQTLQPTRVSLWLRVPPGPEDAPAAPDGADRAGLLARPGRGH